MTLERVFYFYFPGKTVNLTILLDPSVGSRERERERERDIYHETDGLITVQSINTLSIFDTVNLNPSPSRHLLLITLKLKRIKRVNKNVKTKVKKKKKD